jgi:diguanylate cyclase (GGDEF)-like protein
MIFTPPACILPVGNYGDAFYRPSLSYQVKSMRSTLQRVSLQLLTDDFRQRRRLTVVLMTAGVYLVCAGILMYGALTGLFAPTAAGILSAACAATPILMFAVIRSGLNLRFAEPSLALPQALCAQTLIAAAYAVSGPVHPCTLILLATVMVFGMFEMQTMKVWKLMTYTIVLMGIVMVWRAGNDPVMYPAALERIYFLLTATVLPSISSLSVQLRRMRERLRTQKAELESALSHIRQVATHDELTGLPNRRHMLTLLAEHAERHGRGGPGFMVALADMDHFKSVNDTFGHRAGDDALICFAKQARVHLRNTDIVGRWGGEEFLIILPESPPGDPNIGIERLRGALAVTEASRLAPHLRLAFSAGIARYQSDEELDDVIERADGALYAAKHAGRNRSVTR